ncbi:MAG: hypothetical protein AAGG56_01230 [Pseudomonadota bacterium]
MPMRMVLVVVFAALALWRAWIDWHATISQGYAYRLASVESAVSSFAPSTYRGVTQSIQSLGLPWLWDPVTTFILGLPLALLPAALALVLWLTRRRARGRG